MKVKRKMTLQQRVVGIDKMSDEQHAAVRQSPKAWPMEYVVKKVIGSTIPRVHDVLPQEEIDKYCNDENWEVTIT